MNMQSQKVTMNKIQASQHKLISVAAAKGISKGPISQGNITKSVGQG